MALDLGWCQGYMGLQYHYEDALIEKDRSIDSATSNPPIAIFSHKYVDSISKLDSDKIYDFCFIGSINSCPERREWVVDFVRKNFTSNSVFVNTDNISNWTLLGPFDYTTKKLGYCPKDQADNQSRRVQYRIIEDNLFYFKTMKQSKFVLCPAGDAPWSFRFYEVLMCNSMPIVESWHHTYRTVEEASIKYNYVLYNDNDTINKLLTDNSTYTSLIDVNTGIFKKYHML